MRNRAKLGAAAYGCGLHTINRSFEGGCVTNGLSYSVAVFASETQLIFVSLAENQDAARAAAMGYGFVGTIGIEDGKASAHIEPGCAAVMALAGLAFAEILGPRLKEWQEQQAAGHSRRK